jgi:zinc-ribbon domain
VAFCNSCGATVESGAKFCPRCGQSQPVSGAVPSTGASPGTPPPASGNTLKLVLIVFGVIVALGVIGLATVAFVGMRIARHTRVETKDGKVRVESPFGTVVTTTNPDEVARNLGVDLYPGARIKQNNAANVDVGGIHTVAAELESDDPPDKVADFYKSKLANANVTMNGEGHYSIVSKDKKSLITINIEPQDGKTLIHIANVSGKNMTGGSGD